jgi:hypothetical protein
MFCRMHQGSPKNLFVTFTSDSSPELGCCVPPPTSILAALIPRLLFHGRCHGHTAGEGSASEACALFLCHSRAQAAGAKNPGSFLASLCREVSQTHDRALGAGDGADFTGEVVEGTRLLRWSGASNGIGSHRLASVKAGVSQIAERPHRIGFARLRHKKTLCSDERGDASGLPFVGRTAVC